MTLVKGLIAVAAIVSAMGASASDQTLSVLDQAMAANQKAKSLGFEWTVTAPAIKKAKAALEAGEDAQALAEKALLLAEASVFQAENETATWEMRVPK